MNNKTHVEINVGIDTSQSQLDIYVRPTEDYFSVANTPEGAKEAAGRTEKQRRSSAPSGARRDENGEQNPSFPVKSLRGEQKALKHLYSKR